MVETYDPNQWLISMKRSLEEYISNGINAAVKDNNNVSAGLEMFDIRFDWPDSNDVPEDVEFQKTIIHFLITDIENKRLGFGDNIIEETIVERVDPDPSSVTVGEASEHQIEFDIGIWASDQSGGVTNRLVAYQILTDLLQGEMARVACKDITEGVEIMTFHSGRFITDTISDIRVFRVTDISLRVRVFSRKAKTDLGIVVEEMVFDPGLTIVPEGSLAN